MPLSPNGIKKGYGASPRCFSADSQINSNRYAASLYCHHTIPMKILTDFWNALNELVKDEQHKQNFGKDYLKGIMNDYLKLCNIDVESRKTITDALSRGIKIHPEGRVFSYRMRHPSGAPQKFPINKEEENVFFDAVEENLSWQAWNIVLGPGSKNRIDDPGDGQIETWNLSLFEERQKRILRKAIHLGNIMKKVILKTNINKVKLEELRQTMNSITDEMGYKCDLFPFNERAWKRCGMSPESNLYFNYTLHDRSKLPKGSQCKSCRYNYKC